MANPSLFEDMDLGPIRAALSHILSDGAEAIHWHDPDGTFAHAVNDLGVENLDVIPLRGSSVLELKIRLNEVPSRPFLFYTEGAEPKPSDDPFLDVKTYARPFRADAASLKLGELGLADRLDLVLWVERRKKFLASTARTAKFRALLEPRDTEFDLDRKAISVLVKATTSEPREVLLATFDTVESLDAEPAFWKDLVSFDLVEAFWSLVTVRFAIPEDVRTLRALLLRLFATDLCRACPSKALGSSVTSLKLAADQEARVFLSQWRDSSSRSASYARLARATATFLKVPVAIGAVSIDELAAAETFDTVDQRIIVGIRDEVLAGLTDSRRSDLDDMIQRRLASHWPRQTSGEAITACYEGLAEAMDLLDRVARFEQELPITAHQDLAKAYLQRWYLIDSAYRRFSASAQVATAANYDVLKPLADRIEDVYSVGYLAKLGSRWSEALDASLLADWKIPGVPLQCQFFKEQVQAALEDGLKRIYVVISDALRYEAGVELADRLRKFRYAPEVGPMLSVLPSATMFGMAALLPHSKLTLQSGTQLLADGQSTTGSEARNAILATVGGMAVRAEDLKAIKRDEGRAMVKDARVVYIYHNIIDAIGDKAGSESGTFAAVDDALDDLVQLIRRIIDQLNGSTVIVTADHGFLYSESSPTEIDKSSLGGKIESAVIAKKRMVVGADLPTSGPFHRVNLSATAGIEGDLEAIYPRSTQRFHLAGGAKYLHGGPMPQEVFVPLLVVKEKEGDAARATEVRPVGITLATNATRVTVNQQTWRFLQTESVDERHRPLRATIGIYDGLRPVSDVQTVVFDSETDVMSDRERRVRLTLSNESFDQSRIYHLRVRNADDGTEVLSQPLTLHIAFTNEF
jgi:uncharacterized protein (TIGR02687 family)